MNNVSGTSPVTPIKACKHTTTCPPATAMDHDAAHITDTHHDQGWIRLCNGVIVFDDTGEILPDGRPIAPHRPALWHGKPVAA